MGDGFVDTCFVGGESSTYHKYMVSLYESLFSLEPLKSHKEYFNVKYAPIAYQDTNKDNLLGITLMNVRLDGSARGTCWMHDPEIFVTHPSSGFAAAYFTLRDDMTEVLVHEAIGHGFAKLNDEYFNEKNKVLSKRMGTLWNCKCLIL